MFVWVGKRVRACVPSPQVGTCRCTRESSSQSVSHPVVNRSDGSIPRTKKPIPFDG